MSVLDRERMNQIKQVIKQNPRGMSISDITSEMKINRNLVSHYLDMLLVAGEVEMQRIGAAKVYFLSHRLPISAMLEFSSDLVIVLDEERRILMVNQAILDLLKINRDCLVGIQLKDLQNPFIKTLRDYLPPEGSPPVAQQDREISCTLGNREVHLRMKQVLTGFEDGSQGITLILEDITDQVSFQNRLLMSEARYRGIVEDQTEFIVRFRPDMTTTFVNDAYARYLEKESSELVGQPFAPCTLEDDIQSLNRALNSLEPDKPASFFECRIEHTSGEIRWNAWTIRALHDDSGNPSEYQCVGRDNTEKHEAAAKINKYIKEMEFLAQASRDFRDMEETGDIFEYTARRVYSLAPGFLAWVGLIDLQQSTLRIRSVVGDTDSIRQLDEILGKRFVDMVFPIELEETAALLQRRTLVRAPSIYRLLHMQFSEDVCQRIEEASFGGIDSYLMGLVSRGRIVGDVGISLPHGTPLPNRGLIEAFIRQAAIAIEWKIADDNLRQSLARERKQVQNLKVLSRTAMDLIEMDCDTDIFQYIGETIMGISDCAFVATVIFDTNTDSATVRSIAAKPGNLKVLQKLGINPIGMTFSRDPEKKVFGTRLEEGPPIFFHLSHRLPEKVCRSLEKCLGIEKNYIMKLGHLDQYFGTVVIVLERGKDLANKELLEAFINQAAVALLRRTRR